MLPAPLLLLTLLWSAAGLVHAGQDSPEGPVYIIAGRLIDNQAQPVPEAQISAHLPGRDDLLGETESQQDGNWRLALEEEPVPGLQVIIERPHFESEEIILGSAEVTALSEDGIYGLGELELQRKITAGFWAATVIFAGVLALIALEKLHSTTAALAGISAVFLVSFAAVLFWPDLYIINFERALTYINWEVIFLVMAMMIVIAVIEGTGIFQWTAFQAIG